MPPDAPAVPPRRDRPTSRQGVTVTEQPNPSPVEEPEDSAFPGEDAGTSLRPPHQS